MKAKVADLRTLLQKVLDKSGESATPKGSQRIADAMNNAITDRYIYDHLYHRIKEFEDNDEVSVRDAQIDVVAKYIGFKNFKAFVNALKENRHPQLDSCIGSYYSFVRANAAATSILRSPVRIYFEEGQYKMQLRGKRNLFTGEISFQHGCLFVLLQAVDGKAIHHVYKIGVMSAPQILQGIFSGVSSAFDPIGGRVVLVAVEAGFEQLEIAQLLPSAKGKDPVIKAVLNYLDSSSENNLSINRPTTFTIQDLLKK